LKSDLEGMGGKHVIKDPRFVSEHAVDPEYSLLTRSSDGQMLFLANLLSKMKQGTKLGSRIAEVHNGSSLFTGDAGQGESNIRRWVIENDWLEAIVALPLNMFYNTGIATYVWILSNRKPKQRKGKVQLINATGYHSKMRKSLGSKRKWLNKDQHEAIVRLYGEFTEGEESKIFSTTAFGYRRITVERPLRLNFQADDERIERLAVEKAIQKLDEAEQQRIEAACRHLDPETCYRNRDAFTKDLEAALRAETLKPRAPTVKAILSALSERDEEAETCTDRKGNPEPDTDLRDHENVPLNESVHDYFEREVRPHVPDAWIDDSKRDPHDGEIGIVGYEIPFNRYFYKFVPPRPLEEIDADLKECTNRIKRMIEEISA
jgi:type I restriction enzyme M protein